jgi:hypothetical protein
MRHLFGASAAALAIALAVGLGKGEAADLPLSGLTNTRILIVDARSRRYPRYYYSGGSGSFFFNHCFNRDEIRELQRRYPETNWPRSMRCYPHR